MHSHAQWDAMLTVGLWHNEEIQAWETPIFKSGLLMNLSNFCSEGDIAFIFFLDSEQTCLLLQNGALSVIAQSSTTQTSLRRWRERDWRQDLQNPERPVKNCIPTVSGENTQPNTCMARRIQPLMIRGKHHEIVNAITTKIQSRERMWWFKGKGGHHRPWVKSNKWGQRDRQELDYIDQGFLDLNVHTNCMEDGCY